MIQQASRFRYPNSWILIRCRPPMIQRYRTRCYKNSVWIWRSSIRESKKRIVLNILATGNFKSTFAIEHPFDFTVIFFSLCYFLLKSKFEYCKIGSERKLTTSIVIDWQKKSTSYRFILWLDAQFVWSLFVFDILFVCYRLRHGCTTRE